MTITEEERLELEGEFREAERQRLSDRMRALGKIRSKKKAAASRRNASLARAARHIPKKRKR